MNHKNNYSFFVAFYNLKKGVDALEFNMLYCSSSPATFHDGCYPRDPNT